MVPSVASIEAPTMPISVAPAAAVAKVSPAMAGAMSASVTPAPGHRNSTKYGQARKKPAAEQTFAATSTKRGRERHRR